MVGPSQVAVVGPLDAPRFELVVTYLLPAPYAPVVHHYSVAPNSRFNVWTPRTPEDTDVSAAVTHTTGAARYGARRASMRDSFSAACQARRS